MADKPPEEESAEGVFGNLPGSRPGARSPRRGAGGGRKEDPEPTGRRITRATPPPSPPVPDEAPSPPAGSERPVPDPEPGQRAKVQGVEDLAWVGVAIAAQAATVGVRFASRALEAARNSIDRS